MINMLNGNIQLKLKDSYVTLIAEKNNTTILELPLEDDYYALVKRET